MDRDALSPTPEQVALRAARCRMAFNLQLAVYAAVCTGLVLVWALTPSTRFWPGFVMVGWGLALVVQAAGRRMLAPGSATWERVHAEELARARRAAARRGLSAAA